MFARRVRHDFIDAEVGGDAVDLVEKLLARFVVIDLIGAGDGLVTVEPVEHFEIGRDSRHSPAATASAASCITGSEAVQLQLRMIGAASTALF